MELNNTDKLIKEFEVNLKKDLQELLIKKGHVDSGDLLKSIQVTYKSNSNGKFHLELTANEYIKYLDKDNFLKDYLKKATDTFIKKLATEITKDIANSLTF